VRPEPVKPQAEWERVDARNREAMRRGAGLPRVGTNRRPSKPPPSQPPEPPPPSRHVLGQIDRSKPSVETPAYMRRRGCTRREGVSSWCEAHGAYFVAGRVFCWATVRPNGDPLHVPDDVPTSPPVVDDRWMVLFWVAAALGFLLICALAAYAVGLRTHGG
jgi:hypothetical protein